MLEKFLNKAKKPSSRQDPDPTADLHKALFDFLAEQIPVPGKTDQLILMARKAAGKKAEDVLYAYLLFEKYLTSFEGEGQYTRVAIRESIRQRFPALLNEPVFQLLFVSATEQKNILAIQFLQSFLSRINNRFRRTGDDYLEKKKLELTMYESGVSEGGTFRKLQFLSFELFRFVENNYGDTLAAKTFEKTFETFSSKYKELELFPHMISLIPKGIMDREHLGIFTQAQIEQIFLEKLAESEQLNMALDQKIKENEATQRLLLQNEIMLSSVISNAPDAIVLTNQEGVIIRWNKAAAEIFGYPEDEAKGRTLMETIISASFLEAKGLYQFLSEGSNHILNKRLELMGIRKSRVEFPMELTVTSIQHDNEYYFNVFVRDISSRKQREAELVRLKEKAEQAAKAKAQFLSVMSHELRTPLNAVIGITHLLLQANPREDQQEDLRTLQFSGESLLHIINDILDFTKLDSGKIELSAIDFNLRDLVQSLYLSFSYKAKEKDIVFDIEYDEKMPFMVKGDNFRLSQVLNNLISNAIKFTKVGFVKLRVELIENKFHSFLTRFSVIDTGIGIPEDKKDKIFERFTQADSDTTRLYGGTGLGLSISAKLVELMGSAILLDSEPGKGSDFHFSIMLQKADTTVVSAPVHKQVARNNDAFRNKMILLAEDNLFNANIARRFISGWGGELDLVVDGRQALEFAFRKKYDLILLDVQMPVLDGFACARKIRKHLPDIPIIAVTASPKNEIIGEIMACGMNDFVSKPFKPNELRDKILEYLV